MMKRQMLMVALVAAVAGGMVYAESRLHPPSRLGSRLNAPSSRSHSSSSARGGPENLCYNGSFDSTNSPLDGWTTDYRWTSNKYYEHNHEHISVLKSYGGKRDVLYIDGRPGETLIECRAIPYEAGVRYRCTMDLKTTATPHFYFKGYMWEPGVRPYADKPVHLGDLRFIYRSDWRKHTETSKAGGWKQITFDFPMETPSAQAQRSLKALRYFTIYFIIPNDFRGEAWIDNVSVTRIP